MEKQVKVILDMETAEKLFSEHDELENAKLEIVELRKILKDYKLSHLELERKLDCANKKINHLQEELEHKYKEILQIRIVRDALMHDNDNLRALCKRLEEDVVFYKAKNSFNI